MSAPRVVVIGGGLSGISAALTLADAGAQVTLLERRQRLGGLTWSFWRNGLSFDNGQHVFLRCCSAYLEFLERIGADDDVYLQPRLDIPVLSPKGTSASIARSSLRAPFHLAPALARYKHLGIGDRLRLAWPALALSRLDPDDPSLDSVTFGTWLSRHGQSDGAIERLWNLIALPTINVPAAEAGSSGPAFWIGPMPATWAGHSCHSANCTAIARPGHWTRPGSRWCWGHESRRWRHGRTATSTC
jgi:phytoene dehydrogenase-like protein